MYFSHAAIEVNPIIPPIVAFIISFFTSMGGVSGAFLLLPFQMSILGYTSPSVSGTNQLFNIVAIPTGVYRYIKEGRMVWPLTLTVIIGTLPGVLLGAIIRVNYLPEPTKFKFFVGLVLFYIGLRMVKDLLKKSDKSSKKLNRYKNGTLSTVLVKEFSLRCISYDFCDKNYKASTLGIFSLSAIVGVIGGIYGIGGGAIIAPFFISFFGLPVHTVAGAALMGTFVTSVAGVIFYQAIAPFYPNLVVAPDWLLGILFGIGGSAGMYLGARAQKFVPSKVIKLILCFCIFFVAGKYILNFFLK